MTTITKTMNTMQLSVTEAKAACSRVGFVLRKDGDEFEVYPKGKRGAASYFTNDRTDAVNTARLEAARIFRGNLFESLPITDETRDALCEWHKEHGAEWKDQLYRAWNNGNYGSFSRNNVSSTLQRLRNTNGHEVLDLIP